MINSEYQKEIMILVGPLIKSINEIFIQPKLGEISNKLKGLQNKVAHLFENKFNVYLKNSYEKYSIMSTIVLHNQQKLLKELYVPLTLVNSEKEEFIVNKYDNNFLPHYERILITDTVRTARSKKGLLIFQQTFFVLNGILNS